MQRLEVSCAVRRLYTSLGAKGLNVVNHGWVMRAYECVLACVRTSMRNVKFHFSVNSCTAGCLAVRFRRRDVGEIT